VGSSEFVGYRSQTLDGEVEGILTAYPPPYLVGEIPADSTPKVILTEETDLVTVTLQEISAEVMFSNPDGLFNLSVPNMLWRNPNTYVQMNYKSFKIMAMRMAGTFTGPSAEADKFIVTRTWADHVKTAPTILAVMIKNKAQRITRVSIKLHVADNEKKNVEFPITEIKENIFSNDNKQAYIFIKIDPTKEGWGDIKCEVTAKPGQSSAITTYNSSYSTGVGTSSVGTGVAYYGSVGYGNTSYPTTSSYKPIGFDSDTKVACVHCQQECDVGQDFCAACGNCPTELHYETVA